MIEIKNVCYQYPKSGFCLENINMTIKTGQCTAIGGANGSGKTTLSKLIAGILRPSRGEIFIDGQSTSDMTLGQIGSLVGFLFQEPARQLFAVTVEEELTFAQIFEGTEVEKAKKKAHELLCCFGMEDMKQQHVQTLSRGEKQRLAICALLCNDPKVIILDEPTSGLDDENVKRLSQIIDKLIQNKKTVILISHDENFIKKHSHRIIKIKAGAICEF